jgi:hypothetical protein
MIKKYVLRNRNLATWVAGGTLLGGNCDAADASLNGVALLLQVIAASL